jgi:hypothetical protein
LIVGEADDFNDSTAHFLQNPRIIFERILFVGSWAFGGVTKRLPDRWMAGPELDADKLR